MKQGQDLFSSLIDKIGQEDETERLRVSIVEGEVPKQRSGYFVVIGENIDATEKMIFIESIFGENTFLSPVHFSAFNDLRYFSII